MREARANQDQAVTLPDPELRQLDGRPAHLSDYRQDCSLVALFSGGAECGPCRHAIMSDVCARADEYREVGAAAVLVLRCSAVEAELVRRREGLTLPVLLDAAGEACRMVGAETPNGRVGAAIAVIDCAGRVCLRGGGDENGPLPTREAILSCLRNIPARNCTE